MTTTCNWRCRNKLSVLKSRNLPKHALNCALGTNSTFLKASRYTSYPFTLYTILPLTWEYSACCDGFFLITHLCTGIAGGNGWCKGCGDLVNNDYLQKILARVSNGIHENTPLAFHGVGGLINIVHWKMQTIDGLHLHHLNNFKKLVGKEGTINIQKQLLLAISSQCIPRLDHVLQVGFHCGTGIHAMLKHIKKAAEGTYHPKGFDEEEELQVLLFLCLGGA